MTELGAISGPGSAFVAGLITSLHCAGMCGPLACALLPTRGDAADPELTSTVYHLGRLASYTALGAVAGAVGRVPLGWLTADLSRWAPWLLVAFFIGLGLRVDLRLPRLKPLARIHARLGAALRGQGRLRAAATLGLGTPLLPCGPLYVLVSLAALSGSAANGAHTLLAFGFGTVPLLWFAQSRVGWLQSHLRPAGMRRMQVVLAVTTALVLAWRLRGSLGLSAPGPGDFLCF